MLSQTAENDSRFGLPHSNFEVTEAPNTNLKVKDTLVRSDGTSVEDSISQSSDEVNTKFSLRSLIVTATSCLSNKRILFKELDRISTGLRAMLVAFINTAKGNSNEFLQNCKKYKEFIKQTFSIT